MIQMPQKVQVTISGDPPFAFLIARLVKDEDFLKDARRILDLEQSKFELLAAQLAASEEFLGRDELKTVAESVLSADENARELGESIYRISSALNSSDVQLYEAMDELEKAITSKMDSLSKEDRKTLSLRLRSLAAEPAGLAKQAKAKQLVDALGVELNGFRIYCDLRPIFDENRQKVEGLVPINTIKLEHGAPSGNAVVTELRVTDEQLAQIEEEVAKAKRKLNTIKELAKKQGIPIPRVNSASGEDQ